MRKAILTMTIFAVVLTSCMAASEEKMERIIYVKGNNGTVVFELNNSKAADDLWKQLPIETEVGNFSNNEKIFYPEKGLDTSDAPLAEGGEGTLAYYRPWGNVVMFYGNFSPNTSLYGLGRAVGVSELISALSGAVSIVNAE